MTERSWDPKFGLLVLLGLAIAYFPNLTHQLFDFVGIRLGPGGPPDVILWNWVAVAVLVAFIYRVEGRDLASILMTRPSKMDILWAVLFAIVGLIITMVTSAIFTPPEEGTGILLEYSLPVIVALIVTTSITEEILFRGYVIERLGELTEWYAIGVGVSFVLFVLPHVTFFGTIWLITNGSTVVLLYILYVWRRNLVACMIMHLIGNSIILIPALGLA